MPATLSELITERRAKIDAFNVNPPDDLAEFQAFDISVIGNAIERAPITSRDDALAAVDLIRDEIEAGQHLTLSMVVALRRYLLGAAVL